VSRIAEFIPIIRGFPNRKLSGSRRVGISALLQLSARDSCLGGRQEFDLHLSVRFASESWVSLNPAWAGLIPA